MRHNWIQINTTQQKQLPRLHLDEYNAKHNVPLDDYQIPIQAPFNLCYKLILILHYCLDKCRLNTSPIQHEALPLTFIVDSTHISLFLAQLQLIFDNESFTLESNITFKFQILYDLRCRHVDAVY